MCTLIDDALSPTVGPRGRAPIAHLRLPRLLNPAFRPGALVDTRRSSRLRTWRVRMSQTAAASISGRPRTPRTPIRGRRFFAANYRWVDDALRHRTDGYRLLDSPLVGLPGVQRLYRRRFRRSAFGEVRAGQALLQQATERAAEVLTPRQVLALQLYCEGQPMATIAARPGLRSGQHLWAAYRHPAVEAVTREFPGLAQAEFRPNQGRISVPLFLEGGSGL